MCWANADIRRPDGNHIPQSRDYVIELVHRETYSVLIFLSTSLLANMMSARCGSYSTEGWADHSWGRRHDDDLPVHRKCNCVGHITNGFCCCVQACNFDLGENDIFRAWTVSYVITLDYIVDFAATSVSRSSRVRTNDHFADMTISAVGCSSRYHTVSRT